MTPNVSVSHITLFAVDPFKTAEFYNTLGLNLQPTYSWGGYQQHLDILEDGRKRVFFDIYKKTSLSEVNDGLGFEVDNVAETLQKLIKLGAQVTRPGNPKVHRYATIAQVVDPDGRRVGLYQRNR